MLASAKAAASKKGARTRKSRRAARERQGIIEAKIARAPRAVRDDYDALVGALYHMRDTSPHELSLAFDVPPVEDGSSQLWLVRGTFRFSARGGYAELAEVLDRWRNDLGLAMQIHPQRISFIRWHYTGARKDGGYSPSALGAWDRVIDEANADAEGFAETYSESELDYFAVQFAARTLTGPVVKL